ncbi:diguanylate cyclase [Tumidithrix elongata RA019]|uniref:Diguanylate cyclase n=1 Tax=Tumidithrix elongata BACA0141 TaxID=2716417 RepID=A0AAW9Q661_9CYAN|nr:diguanylate cyclase [Tumidithrix elongata RA019]
MDLHSLNYRRHQLKVLVIDDDTVTANLVSQCLSEDGYLIDIATTAETGWERALATQPDVIVSSWSLPDISGLALCQRFKANQEYPELRSTYFILLTLYANYERRLFGLDAGADELLTKPIDPAELRARVRTGLRLCLLSKALALANQKLLTSNKLLTSLDLTDTLTGVLNRRSMSRGVGYLLEHIAQAATAGEDQTYLSVLIVDIDRLQQVNAQYGHAVGDEVLTAIAGRLQNACTPSSLLYRYGSGMFVCVTPDCAPEASKNLANQLVLAINRNQIALSDGLHLSVTISVGGAVYGSLDGAIGTKELLNRAKHALNLAKQSGKNCMRMYDAKA